MDALSRAGRRVVSDHRWPYVRQKQARGRAHVALLVLAVAFALGLFPGMARRAYADVVRIYVGGQLLSKTGDFVSGEGGTAMLTYDDNGNPVLTLDNYTYNGTGYYDSTGQTGAAIYYSGRSPLTIVLMDNNSVTHAAGSGDESAGILIANNADLTIAGTGSLTVAGGNTNSRSSGIKSMSGNITISGGTVNATSSNVPYSYAICADAEEKAVTISGGKVIATGGSGQYSAGILGGGVVISNAEVEATGGISTEKSGPGSSEGIAVARDHIDISNSKVTAKGGSAAGSYSRNSYGIHCASRLGGVTISGESTVEATGGVADNTSCGINSEGAVGISGSSQVNATGGKAQSGSHGIYGRDSVTISDEAKVEALGSMDGANTYGISCDDGSISFDGGEVTAAGNNKACYGTVKNTILGRGWTDADDKQGKAPIKASAEGQTLTYIRVQFPASMATVTKAPEPKDLTYTGSAQDLVTAGNAEDGTMQYSLNGETWSEAIPAGTNVGEYTVWYKAAGDEEYLDSEAQKLTVAIKEKDEPKPEPQPEPAGAVALALTGSGHMQNVGDVAARASGKGIVIGTTGEAKRLEQLIVSLPKDTNGGIEYRAHLQGIGWGDWVQGGRPCGTTGEARRMEAVQMRLTGALAETHSVWYRVHSQTWGTLGWAHDGQAAGTSGQAKRGEAVEVQVLPQGQAPEGYEEKQASYVGAVSADVHLQKVGWTGASSALEFGTTGQARRLEAVRISAPATPVSAGISYEVHAQSRGWMPAAADGALAGTTGQVKRLEAVRISLTGDAAKVGGYSVWYRVHSQTYGWLGWTCDGKPAGTTGLAKRAEAIDVQVLPQGQLPRGYDAGRAACVNG